METICERIAVFPTQFDRIEDMPGGELLHALPELSRHTHPDPSDDVLLSEA